MNNYLNLFEESIHYIEPYAGKFLLTISITIIFAIARNMVVKYALSRAKKSSALIWKKNINYSLIILIAIVYILIWLPYLRGFFTLFSIIGTGLIVVLKEIFLNIAGWIYIILRKPFEIGNRIMINNITGDVIDIRIIEFSMLEVKPREDGGQSTGRIIRVPNSLLFTQPMANASKDFSLYWNEIPIKISLNSNIKKAEQIIYKIEKEHFSSILRNDSRLKQSERNHHIHYKQISSKIYISYSDEAIILTLRHLSEPRSTRDLTDIFWKNFLPAIKKEKDIKLI